MNTKDITILTVDTYAHELTRRAIELTLDQIPCREVVVLSDRNIYPDGRWIDINPIDINDYNDIMVKHLWPFIRTEHVLVVQYDGLAINSQYWTDDFLNYDYIGAIWPWPHHPPGFKVGNGGFSLRSRRLLNALKDKKIVRKHDLPMYEDLYIGVFYKEQLASMGIKIADESVAQKFSHEHFPGRRETFGFHGSFNVPYYLNDRDAEFFINHLPGRVSEGSQLMIMHFFLNNRDDLARMALDLARKSSDNFDQQFKNTIIKTANETGDPTLYDKIYTKL
jgi:hypothetical protein